MRERLHWSCVAQRNLFVLLCLSRLQQSAHRAAALALAQDSSALLSHETSSGALDTAVVIRVLCNRTSTVGDVA